MSHVGWKSGQMSRLGIRPSWALIIYSDRHWSSPLINIDDQHWSALRIMEKSNTGPLHPVTLIIDIDKHWWSAWTGIKDHGEVQNRPTPSCHSDNQHWSTLKISIDQHQWSALTGIEDHGEVKYRPTPFCHSDNRYWWTLKIRRTDRQTLASALSPYRSHIGLLHPVTPTCHTYRRHVCLSVYLSVWLYRIHSWTDRQKDLKFSMEVKWRDF